MKLVSQIQNLFILCNGKTEMQIGDVIVFCKNSAVGPKLGIIRAISFDESDNVVIILENGSMLYGNQVLGVLHLVKEYEQ